MSEHSTEVHLAVVGSRGYTDYTSFCKHLENYIASLPSPPTRFISGGAIGTDQMAERYAAEHSIPMTVFKPDWTTHGRKAGILRNADIITASTHVVAFLAEGSIGTRDSIKRAKLQSKQLLVIEV